MNDKYIYSENDFAEAMRGALKDMFGYELQEFIAEESIKNLKYSNLYRFYERNCVGCVGGNTECDLAYNKGEAKGCWEKAMNGLLFDCPIRVNGTMMMGVNQEGVRDLKQIDISDRKEKPYPVVKID